MVKTADIVIIGGGISGVSIGYFLLKHGAKNVVILERNYLAAGATGRCGAGIRQQWGSPLNCIMSKFSCEFFETAVEELKFNEDIEFHQGGYMMLVTTQKELAQTKENIALQNSLGINTKLLTPQEAKALAPPLNTEGLLAAAFHSRDGHLNPFTTTRAFANAFTRLGGKIYTNTTLTGIQTANGRVTQVDTSQGSISTSTVVNAAGGYVQTIADMVNIKLPLYSQRHNI